MYMWRKRKYSYRSVLCALLVLSDIYYTNTKNLYLVHLLLFFILVPNFWSFLCNSEAEGKEITRNAELPLPDLLAESVSNFDRSVGERDFEIQIEFHHGFNSPND